MSSKEETYEETVTEMKFKIVCLIKSGYKITNCIYKNVYRKVKKTVIKFKI